MQGEAVDAIPGRHKPHLVLTQCDAGPGYAATIGCNQLIGQFGTGGGVSAKPYD